MQCVFGNLYPGILILASGLINRIVLCLSSLHLSAFSLLGFNVKRQICLKLWPKPKIKASSISWDGCEHSLQRGNTPTRALGDLGSISSLTTLLAAESWIIRNPPEHGNTRGAGRETAIKHTQQNKVQGRKEGKKKNNQTRSCV